MKLLRDFSLLRVLRRLAVGRPAPVRRSYTVTVPAPLACSNVVELRRPGHGTRLTLVEAAPLGRVANA